MVPATGLEPTPGFVTLLRFRTPDPVQMLADLRQAIALLATFDGFIDARLARAVDEAELISVSLGWTNVGAYRRALSAFDVKVSVVPLLSMAVDEPTAFEVLQVTDAEGTVTAVGTLAADAGTVSLGHASAEHVRPEPS